VEQPESVTLPQQLLFNALERKPLDRVKDRQQVMPAGQLVLMLPVGLLEQALGPVASDRALEASLDPDAEPEGLPPAWEGAERQQRAASPCAPTSDGQELRGEPKPFTRSKGGGVTQGSTASGLFVDDD
jgi:hypothetical protein